ncbi:MAG: glycosyltransferase [Fulvivirga sp.]
MILMLEIILVSYLIFLISLIIGWLRVEKHTQSSDSPALFYSIIIPFRNEAEHLGALISSLKSIDFPATNFEVILVNDHSTDDFLNILTDLPSNFITINADGQGKKSALATGIRKSKGEVIVTTDADCKIPEGWLSALQPYFEKQKAKLVYGPVAFDQRASFFNKVQQVEFASLIGSGAATLQWGLPTMCNGANLAFLKSAFLEVGGYNDNIELPSGDDEFLMHKIYASAPEKVYYMKNKNAVVSTKPSGNWKIFVNQRKRWASKWKSYKSIKNSLLAIIVALFNLSIIASTVVLIDKFQLSLVTLLVLKIVLEFIFLKSVLNSLTRKLSITAFLFLQICYPYYVVLFGLSANFGSYSWKGRKHQL